MKHVNNQHVVGFEQAWLAKFSHFYLPPTSPPNHLPPYVKKLAYLPASFSLI